MLKVETIGFPNPSCNWSQFSEPEHVRYIKGGNKQAGCYSFTVSVARYKSIATPVHDPDDDALYPNYAHVEIRELQVGEGVLCEPPKERKKKRSKRKRAERQLYRMNLVFNIKTEIPPK